MSWHRTYRPQQIKSLHLENIRQALLSFMQKGQIPQVMLFAGPKGTGKTSSARIIGAILNDPANEKMADFQFFDGNKPKKVEYAEPDVKNDFNQQIFRGESYIVQEMDAASNRGIDDIRDLQERIALPPQTGKMTVYILDEAHMLTPQAFNALLKLLEEPPAHAVFILATTELHKIPETIKSRCSILHFRKANHEEIKQALGEVLSAEKIEADDESLDLIVERADGSFRDAVKLLEMVAIGKKIDVETVENLLASSVTEDIKQLLVAILDKDEADAVGIFERLRERNVDEKFFLTSLLDYLHLSLLQNLGIVEGEAFTNQKVCQFLLKELSQIDLSESLMNHLQLELKVLDLIQRAKGQSGGQPVSKKTAPPVKKNETLTQAQPKKEIQSKKTAPKEIKEEVVKSAEISGDSVKLLENWAELLSAVKQKNMTLEALLRSAKPLRGENGTAQVQVFYQFHKEQLEHPKFRAMIRECAAPIAGGEVKIEYLLSVPKEADLVEPGVSPEQAEDLAMLAEEILV